MIHFEVITLESILKLIAPTYRTPLTRFSILDEVREREFKLRKFLPMFLVRRLDNNFARSNTVHPSTGNALYHISRAINPKVVVESGTYWGYSTCYLATGVLDAKNRGHIHSFDTSAVAGKHILKDLMKVITLHRGRPSYEAFSEALQGKKVDLFFQDSVHDFEGVTLELTAIAPFLSFVNCIIFHDFVEESVRKAAQESLGLDYKIYILEGSDPQQLGIAIRQ